MLPIFESILPIFLLIVVGNLLSRVPKLDRPIWEGMEVFSYWVLYPTLLFTTILHADLSGLTLDSVLGALFLAVAVMGALALALWPLLRATGFANGPEYTSIFQTTMRWNGFIALAVAQKLYPPEASAVVALAMAAIIIPLNLSSVAVLVRFGTGEPNWQRTMRAMATNPLIISVLLAILLRFLPGGLYGPVGEAVRLVGSAAIGMGLLAIGAGLRPADALRPRLIMWLPLALKLLVFPALLVGLAWLFGVRGDELVYLALCGSVPTAMNGYILARQLGGDAEFYAAEATLQTAFAFLTMPLVLSLAAQLASG
ncbi:MAG: AEC family transporter [Brucellaceae bacterium]|nr:AEC family transporter [Brucellaceae bacterium]